MPGWLGEPLDVGYAIDVLHPLAQRPPAVAAGRGIQAQPEDEEEIADREAW